MRGTKRSQSEDRRNRGAKQNKTAREGLELVREQTEVNLKTNETAAQNKTKPLEKAWNWCVEQKEVNLKTDETAAQNKTKPLEKAWN